MITKKNFALIVISLLIGFCLSELIARLFIPVRNVGPSFTVYDSLYGKRLKKNFSALRVTPEFNMRFSTNSYGFRGPEPPTFPSGSILFLGDSFTMGYGVNDGEEFPDLIRQSLSKQYGIHAIPVINAGMGDNGNGRWIKFLRSEGRLYNPRIVILQIMKNDFYDNLKEHLFELSSNDDLIEMPVPPISNVRIIQNVIDKIPWISYSYLLGLANQVRWSIVLKQPTSPSKQESALIAPNKDDLLTYRILKEVISICDNEGWPMLALIVGLDGQRRMTIENILQENKIPITSVPSQTERPDFYYKIDGHWNKRGHNFAADRIMDKLHEENYLSIILSHEKTVSEQTTVSGN